LWVFAMHCETVVFVLRKRVRTVDVFGLSRECGKSWSVNSLNVNLVVGWMWCGEPWRQGVLSTSGGAAFASAGVVTAGK
jgi:hypothetical protein